MAAQAGRRPSSLPYMVLRGHVWAAKVRVPADIAPKLGRSVFVRSTEETDIHAAWAKAAPWVRTWKQQIEDARQGKARAAVVQIDEARRKLARLGSLDGEAWEVVESLLASLGHDSTTPDVQAPEEASVVLQAIGEATGLASRIDTWEAQLGMGSREARMYASDVRAFCASHAQATVEGLTGAVVQAWIEGDCKGLAPKTIDRKLSALRNYWGWLQAHGVASDTNKPFHGRRLPKAQKDVVKRQAFTPADVVRLLEAARTDQALFDLITLAAYTGARIEELCSLKAEHVKVGGAALVIPGTKTDAAARTVPVHSALMDTLDRLLAYVGPDGYLIPSTADNQHGERSAPLSKRFGRLKTRLGFGEALVFHSIRKTVATLLEDAQCPEGIAADILGHEKPTMTYGLYSSGASLATKREWVEKALNY